jgi:hypothetical protein
MFRMELLNKPRSGDVLRSIMALLADTFGSGEDMLRMELLNIKLRSADVLLSMMALLADTFGSGEVFRKFDGRSGCFGNVVVDGSLEQESAAEPSLLHVPTKSFTTFESKPVFDISGILIEIGSPRKSTMGLPQQSVTTMMLRKTRT